MTRVRGPRRGLNELEQVDHEVRQVVLELQLVELEVDEVLVVLEDLEVLEDHEGGGEMRGGASPNPCPDNCLSLYQTHARPKAKDKAYYKTKVSPTNACMP